MKILLATDGSDCSKAAVDAVAERPWPEGSEVIARLQRVAAIPARFSLACRGDARALLGRNSPARKAGMKTDRIDRTFQDFAH